ncbi:hypothetical protein GH714_029466 [Hevea brasiliensis]|uniref:Uncharacterized protein n=1 Tax=Hevea brasiliensis TaxID=3981 RepID=A0A6A6LMY3_HEVBR|nr:hypothetical protein GH714_029466 [Hevea brasiliensis]
MDTMLSCMDEVSDPFSKFTFTSDVDDLEKLPYVYAKQSQELLLTTNVNCTYHEDSSSRYATQSVDANDEYKQFDNVKLDLVDAECC